MKIRPDYDYPGMNEIIDVAKKRTRGKSLAYSVMKKKATNFTMWAVMEEGFKKIEKPVKVTCNWYRKDYRKDPDNISAGIKFILDGFVKAGLLEDDRMKNISEINNKFFKSDNKKNYVIVELEEV